MFVYVANPVKHGPGYRKVNVRRLVNDGPTGPVIVTDP